MMFTPQPPRGSKVELVIENLIFYLKKYSNLPSTNGVTPPWGLGGKQSRFFQNLKCEQRIFQEHCFPNRHQFID